jgi:hypothetical protein
MKLIYTILFFSISYLGFATNISIDDTTATKGDIINIPVYIDDIDDYAYLDVNNSFNLELEYNALMLDMKSIVTDGTVLENQGVTFVNQLNNENFRASSLDINFEYELSPLDEGILCYIQFEILAGPDERAAVNLVSFTLNQSDTDANFDSGVITIPEPVQEVDKSYISDFYPNPFNVFSQAKINLTKPTRIQIATYNIGGSNMLSNFCYEDCLERHFKLIDSEGNTYNGTELLMPGEYKLELRNDSYALAAGAYLLVIQTDFKVLKQRFMVIK